MSYPQHAGPASLEERVTALEKNTEKNNKNLTDTFEKLITVLNEAREVECELPPFCEESEHPEENG